MRFFLFQGYYYALLGLFGLGLMILLTILSKKIRDYPILVASMCAGLVGNLIFIGNTDQIGMARFTIAAVKRNFLIVVPFVLVAFNLPYLFERVCCGLLRILFLKLYWFRCFLRFQDQVRKFIGAVSFEFVKHF